MVNFRFVAISIAVVASCQQALGLNCWECDSRDYFECGDGENLPSSMYRHCDDEFNGPPVCVKVVSLNLGVRRQCINDIIQASNFCNSVRDFDAEVLCKICDYDGCNGAIAFSPAVALIALLMVLMKILLV